MKTTTRGQAGVTHCGHWIPAPAGVEWSSRLVCTHEPGHMGRHHHGPTRLYWHDGEWPPRKRP